MLIISAITIMLIVLGAVNYQIANFSTFFPMFLVMTVFYWTIFWPRLFSKWLVFALALFQDILYGTPVGITAFLSLIYWGGIISQRRFLVREQFLALWALFAVSLFFYIAVEFVAYSIYYKKILFSYEIIMRFLISVLIYPLVHKFFNSNQMLLRQQKI